MVVNAVQQPGGDAFRFVVFVCYFNTGGFCGQLLAIAGVVAFFRFGAQFNDVVNQHPRGNRAGALSQIHHGGLSWHLEFSLLCRRRA